MKGKIRRIIAIALMVCFIASLTAASASACSCSLWSNMFKGNQILKQVCSGQGYVDNGDQGYQVKLVQIALQRDGYSSYMPSGADGIFGTETYNAVWAYQKDNHYNWRHLDIDGIVGPCTLNALDSDMYWRGY